MSKTDAYECRAGTAQPRKKLSPAFATFVSFKGVTRVRREGSCPQEEEKSGNQVEDWAHHRSYPFVCQPGAHSAIGQICLYKRGSDSFNQSEGFAYIYAKTQLFFTLAPNIYICAFSQHPGLHIAFLEQSG